MLSYYLDNSNTFTAIFQVIQDDGTYAYDNNATLTITVQDQSGVALTGGDTFPLTVPYVAASDGRYQVDLASTLSATDKQKVELVIEGTSSAGKALKIAEPLHMIKRRAG